MALVELISHANNRETYFGLALCVGKEMDRLVNVRLFSVDIREQGGVAFSTALRRIADENLLDREHEQEPDVVIRLERLALRQGALCGEFVRIQERNLPPKAVRGHPIESLGVASIGHTTAFAFDPDLSVLALQIARNGITATRIALYVEGLAGGPGYDILPVPNREIWDVLRRGGIRGLTFRIAAPNELQAIDDETRSVRRGALAMKESLQPSHLEITMGMARGEVDIDSRKAIGLFGWLQRERQDRRGGVSKLSARVIPEGGEEAQPLNLIGGHMGDKEWVDIPDDDPEASYRKRSDYILRVLRENRPVLREMYG
jgi:hypothetical protein